ncbi:hypothetical protein YDYSG_14190 [Paenibacillus tyrfis]|uniref:L,D-transpeptidase family protein n=1 Tax=Paenibacillus tyrfis TaxID=1501230 RepID=UPI0024938E42|nr:L,D-transpeptidase [Paenibacillus tyrfis]GLI05389.1 hypothetical protein YDYSG_14190 [Paenibacillus tyrfis]
MKPKDSKDSEEQLQLFFKQDPFYLKKYVKEHPNNKMAWYLLGRDYEAQGKKGKALYCYAQAGEVYEAYENQKVALPPEEIEPIHRWGTERQKDRRKRFVRLMAVGLLAFAGVLFAPELGRIFEKTEESARTPIIVLPEGMTSSELQETKVYYLAGEKTQQNVGAALQEMLLRERISSYAILARGIPLAGTAWINWLKKPETLLSVEAKANAAQQQIDYHDAAACGCQPSDPQKADGIVAAWMTKQEQDLVLRSAVAAYIRRTGQAPARASQLTEAYPNNMLPGLTPYMKETFDRDKEALAAELSEWLNQPGAQPAAVDGNPVPPGTGQASLTKPLTEPMRIIIDKQAHRLSVVSGNIVVRNYPVGLGAERTPEGSFVISEKVRNPNGKSNGEFGSRGMTLSDTNYAIHGTNRPSSIGKDESLGCIRMAKEDVEELFDLVPLGTSVTIGKGSLSKEESRSPEPYGVTPQSVDTNPGKKYNWLN